MNHTFTQQPLSLSLRTYSGEVQQHDHSFHQIVLPQAGTLDLEVEGHGGRVDAQQGVVIPAGSTHAFLAEHANRFLVLDIGHGALEGDHQRLADQGFFTISPALRHLLDFAASSPGQLAGDVGLVGAWSQLLLSSLLGAPQAPMRRARQCVARAQAYIDRHLDEPLSAQRIARACGTSERQLYVLFNAELGCTPRAWLSRRRLDKAMALLGSSELSITEVAHRVGYADHSALNHALKKAGYPSPSALRKS
ncbi:AraC family transcriptional regulator [Pseudomonas sp. R5(2019)]|uniref:AraC family transcriptional regulator n=1 Tax=Pseudomonas sp. R5(2019) TaxID=2697566 RepID=UPI001411FC44|nr:AraC family transcriptional regulator [Pseudomonas sp. R5(2019)]NBA98595.1 helix-turn-helix domain-containing protein [Pseudomonas sp. R5(2019)]